MVDYKSIIEGTKLSDVSKSQYVYNIGLIEKKWGKSIEHCLKYPDQCVHFINSNYQELQTRKAFINAIATLFKHNDAIKEE